MVATNKSESSARESSLSAVVAAYSAEAFYQEQVLWRLEQQPASAVFRAVREASGYVGIACANQESGNPEAIEGYRT